MIKIEDRGVKIARTAAQNALSLGEVGFNWYDCSPNSLRGHMVNAHFRPLILHRLGIPRFDIEVAAYRGIELGWVVRKAYEKLERPDHEIKAERDRFMDYSFVSVDNYKEMIIKTLLYIEQKELATIDWERAKKSFGKATEIKLNVDEDSNEGPFAETLERELKFFDSKCKLELIQEDKLTKIHRL